MSPSTSSLLPICCCLKNGRKSKKQQEVKYGQKIAVANGSLVIPNVAVNGRMVIAARQGRAASPAHVAIEMTKDYETARNTLEQCDSHLSMKDLMRVVRREEGLKVTPRDDHIEGPSGSMTPNEENNSFSRPNPLPRVLDAAQLANHGRDRPRKAVFDANGDITARTTGSRSAKSRVRSTCSVNTISGEHHLTLSHPPPLHSAADYIVHLPQMLFAVVSVSLAWLASLLSFLSR